MRQRRRTEIEDVFHEAITAVAVAEASKDYMSKIGGWDGATPEEVAKFYSLLGQEASLNHAWAVGAARAALARASAYDVSVRAYLDDFDATYKRADEIMEHLRRGLQRSESR